MVLNRTFFIGIYACVFSSVCACGSNNSTNGPRVQLAGDSGTGASSGTGGTSATGKPALAVTPKTAQASFGGSVQFKASVTGTANTSVTWTLKEGSAGGAVSPAGLYTAPSSSGTFHVVATSTSNSTLTDSGTVTVSAPPGTPPVLQIGVWTDITPPGLEPQMLGHTYGSAVVAIDPSHPLTLYLCVDQLGMWKTTDGGSSWARLGDPSTANNTETQTGYLDSPISVRVDPSDSTHLYATQGVRGNTQGFWISHDAGKTWAQTPGFTDVSTSTLGHRDVTTFDVDPTDFKHILLGSHNAWKGLMNAGLLESMDGGDTWVVHPPDPTWASGSMGVHFSTTPTSAQGNAQTWFVGEEHLWRTTDSGAHWTKVSDYAITHGGNDFYYTKAGVLYAGAGIYPIRSTDNGVTWQQLTQGPPYSYYYSIQGDGTTLYTQLAFTGTNNGDITGKGVMPAPYLTSPETDGLTWTPYQGGKQTFIDGPYVMRFDSANHIMYSANWDAGLWALKVQ